MAAQAAILKSRDYALVQLSRKLMGLMRVLGEVEHDALARRLDKVRIDTPVFVAGLARSGTTMVLTLLERADAVATHRYRDFPFLCVPLAWNWLQDRLGGGGEQAVERPHRDRIRITKESAEAFEEPIWQEFFPWVHDATRCHVLDGRESNADFEAVLRLAPAQDPVAARRQALRLEGQLQPRAHRVPRPGLSYRALRGAGARAARACAVPGRAACAFLPLCQGRRARAEVPRRGRALRVRTAAPAGQFRSAARGRDRGGVARG